MFLAHDEIKKLVEEKGVILKSKPGQFHQSSYDLGLGKEVYIVGKDAPETLSRHSPYISIPPGQFAILTCYEDIQMPDDHMGFISLRTSFKFQGLVNISGFHVDPTHRGTLLFAVQNVGPSDIRLKFEEPTFTIFFAKLTSNKIGKPRSEQDTRFKPWLSGIRLQDVQLLGGSSITIARLQKEIDQLKFIVFVYTPIVVAVLGALIKLFWPSPSTPVSPH
jgi:dCTP deaminase